MCTFSVGSKFDWNFIAIKKMIRWCLQFAYVVINSKNVRYPEITLNWRYDTHTTPIRFWMLWYTYKSQNQTAYDWLCKKKRRRLFRISFFHFVLHRLRIHALLLVCESRLYFHFFHSCIRSRNALNRNFHWRISNNNYINANFSLKREI